jgi:hypothetical protein
MRSGGGKTNHVFGVGQNKQVAAAVSVNEKGESQPPTEEMLATKDHLTAAPMGLGSGFAGLSE